MKKNKRRMAVTLLLLTIMLYITGAAAAFCESADMAQEEKGPYNWPDYEGEVILDDPEFFQFDEETLDENKSDLETHAAETEQDEKTENDETASATETPENTHTEEPAATDDPAVETPADTTEQPDPIDLKDLFQVEIKAPAGWFNLPEKAVRVKITPKGDALWSKILARQNDGEWTEIKEKFSLQDGYYFLDLTATENGKMSVRLLNDTEDYFDTTKEIRIFDHRPPEVTAGIKDTMLHVVAVDDLAEVAGIQVNSLLFTTLEDGVLDVRMEEPLNTYKQLAIRAYDYAGNFSDPVTLDNPYYIEPTPTPKATKKPTVTKEPTAAPLPTATPKPTKKPSSDASGSEPKTVKVTKAPVETAQPQKQEPIVIILTPPPTVEPAPTPTPKIEYVPLGPGQPFTQHGNMATRDVLYSANTNKQFISVQSRAGQTYYMVIDYDKPIDAENEIYETYFLNLVDDRDLMSVLTDEEIIPTPTPQIIYVTPEPTQVPVPTAAPTESAQDSRKMDSTTMLLLIILILLVVGGLVAWFISSQNKKQVPRIPEYEEDEEIEDSEDDLTDSE